MCFLKKITNRSTIYHSNILADNDSNCQTEKSNQLLGASDRRENNSLGLSNRGRNAFFLSTIFPVSTVGILFEIKAFYPMITSARAGVTIRFTKLLVCIKFQTQFQSSYDLRLDPYYVTIFNAG